MDKVSNMNNASLKVTFAFSSTELCTARFHVSLRSESKKFKAFFFFITNFDHIDPLPLNRNLTILILAGYELRGSPLV